MRPFEQSIYTLVWSNKNNQESSGEDNVKFYFLGLEKYWIRDTRINRNLLLCELLRGWSVWIWFICNLYCSTINKYVIIIISNVEMKTNQSTKKPLKVGEKIRKINQLSFYKKFTYYKLLYCSHCLLGVSHI